MTHNNEPYKLNNRIFFYLILIVVFVLSFFVLRPYISAIVLAFITVIFFKPVYEFFLRHLKNHIKISSLISVIIIFFIVLIPILIIGGLTTSQIIQFKEDFSTMEDGVPLNTIIDGGNKLVSLIPGVDYEFTGETFRDGVEKGAKAMGTFFLERLPTIGTGAFHFFTWVIIYITLVYSLFPLQSKLVKFAKELSPLDDRIDKVYITRVIEMSKSMVKGTFLIAIVQGIISGIFLAIVGVDYVLFWTMIMIFLGVIPMIGSGFVMIPAGIILMFTGNIVQGLFVIIGSILIVGNIDNLLRPKLVSKKAELHPALVILGVLGGLQVFGVLGFIYGPVIMILLVTTVEMYLKHFQGQ